MTHSRSIAAGDPESQRRIAIIHGYTGSPDEFAELAQKLAEQLSAYVTVPLLPGHGTDIQDLYPITFDDLLNFMRTHIREVHRGNGELGIIGHSFGGYLALILAKELNPSALALTVVPYTLKFPLSLPGASYFAALKQSWDKKLSSDELKDREGYFFYSKMPGIALSLVLEGKRRADKILRALKMPILAMQAQDDSLSTNASADDLLSGTGGNDSNERILLPHRTHGIFYGSRRHEAQQYIVDFFGREM